MSRSDGCDVNNLYDKDKSLDVFEEYFHRLFLAFTSTEKSCKPPVLTNNAQVVTSGITDSFNGEQYAKPVYRKSMLGDALCTTWTNWVNGKIVSPCSAVGPLITKPKRSENSENNLKFQEKMEFFSKHLDDSLTQKFSLEPTKPRAIRGGNLNHNSQVKTLGNSSPKEMQIFENGSLIKYQPRTQASKTTNHNKQSPPRDMTCPPKCCKFCYNNGEPQVIYGSHMAKFVDGTVSCPILRRYVCELCGATGSYSHTRKYCPLYGNIVLRSQKMQKLI